VANRFWLFPDADTAIANAIKAAVP
jgi:hypothetical protein